MKGKKKIKLLAVFAAVTAVIAGACYTLFIQKDEPAEQYIYKEENVYFGDLTQGITESGSVELLTTEQKYDLELNLDSDDEDSSEEDEETGCLRIEEVYVAAGERMEEGDAVFKLTEKSVEGIRRRLQSAKNEAQIALTEAESTYEAGALTAKQNYDSSVLNGEKAEDEYRISTASLNGNILEAYTNMDVLQNEIDELEKELEDEEKWEEYDDLREAYEEAKEELEDCEENRLSKYITRRNAYLQAKEQYEQARDERLEKSEAIKKKNEEIGEWSLEVYRLLQKLERQNMDARHALENSLQEGELAKEIYEYSVEELKNDVDSAQNELSEIVEKIEAFEQFVGDGVVYAGGSGLLTAVNYEAGDELSAQGTMFSYVTSGNYVITIDISEEDIPYVKVGNQVNITFTAYPDKTYTGSIREIDASASDSHAATVSYPVTVQIEGDTDKLYGGMTGDVTFVTDEVRQVVYVSRKAIVEENGKSCVYTKRADGAMELREVETGFTDGISVEITNGLKEGDVIYIASKVKEGY